MNKRRMQGVTLVEVMVVVAIIAILTSIILPILASAKVKSAQSVCASNLRQSIVALNLYVEDSGGAYPATMLVGKLVRSTTAITAAYAPTGTFHCPLDRKEGRAGLPLDDRREPQSFMRTWLLWEGRSGAATWNDLLAVDANPILFRCYFHDPNLRKLLLTTKELSSFGAFRNGQALVARKDGSIAVDRRPDSWVESKGASVPAKEEIWALATTVACPPSICDGKPPDEGWRGQ